MKKLDFNSYLVDELSKVLHNDDFVVTYVYRHHNKSSILVTPLVTDINDVALRELKQLCVSSKSLGHRYIISLEHLTCNYVKYLEHGFVELDTIEQYELTMPNNPDFKDVVKSLENRSILEDNILLTFRHKKGGVEK